MANKYVLTLDVTYDKSLVVNHSISVEGKNLPEVLSKFPFTIYNYMEMRLKEITAELERTKRDDDVPF